MLAVFLGERGASVTKAKGKGKGIEKNAAAKKPTAAKKMAAKTAPVDMVQVRENINNLVGASAKDIAIEVIKVAMTGQLATAKYLFEAVGLYPATEETSVRPIETTLAHTLLTRMGLPLEPVVCEDDPALPLTTDAKCAAESEEVGEDSDGGPGKEPIPGERAE
jgi:hypothetical protein